MNRKKNPIVKNSNKPLPEYNKPVDTIWRLSKLQAFSAIAERAGNEALFAYLEKQSASGKVPRFFYDFLCEMLSNKEAIVQEARKFGTGIYTAVELAPQAVLERERLIGCWKIVVERASEPTIENIDFPGLKNLKSPFWEGQLAIYIWGKENSYGSDFFESYGLMSSEGNTEFPYIRWICSKREKYCKDNGDPTGKKQITEMWDQLLEMAAQKFPDYAQDILDKSKRKEIRDRVRGLASSRKRSRERGKKKNPAIL